MSTVRFALTFYTSALPWHITGMFVPDILHNPFEICLDILEAHLIKYVTKYKFYKIPYPLNPTPLINVWRWCTVPCTQDGRYKEDHVWNGRYLWTILIYISGPSWPTKRKYKIRSHNPRIVPLDYTTIIIIYCLWSCSVSLYSDQV